MTVGYSIASEQCNLCVYHSAQAHAQLSNTITSSLLCINTWGSLLATMFGKIKENERDSVGTGLFIWTAELIVLNRYTLLPIHANTMDDGLKKVL